VKLRLSDLIESEEWADAERQWNREDKEERFNMSNKKIRKTDASVANGAITVHHEYAQQNGVVVHRIVADKLAGQWHAYQQIATLKTPTGVLYACTDYFHGSLPTNAVFVISEIT
jgi:hypothetical protein